MYSTSFKTWARALSIDSVLIGLLVAGVFFHVPYTLEVTVFALWWLACLGIFFGLIIAVLPGISQAAIETIKEQLALMEQVGDKTSDLYKETAAKLAKAEEGATKLWPVKVVNRLAASRTYLAYRWLTDIAVWTILIIAGHPILAVFKITSFLISCILIGVARKMYRERLGLKTEDDIENEFAKHRAHVR